MGFFSLSYSQKTLAIKNKNRVALVVSLKINQILVFFQDGSFQHHYYSSSEQKVIKKGKLDFIPTQILNSEFKDRVFLKGNGNANNGFTIIAFLNISSPNFQPYQCLMRSKQDIFQSASHHVLKTFETSQHFFIVELIPNVQNGLAVACFDFLNDIWSSEMIYLNSKYFNCKYVNTTNQLQIKKSWSFALLSHGQKIQSILYSKFQIKYNHRSNKQNLIDQLVSGKKFNNKKQENWTLKHGFVCMKQLKLFRNFTILGAYANFHQGNSQFLYIVGNSTSLQTPSEKNQQNLPVIVKVNMTSVDQNIDQKIIFQRLNGFKLGKQIIVREYLGIIDNDMIIRVENSIKKSIHKIRIPKIQDENYIKNINSLKKSTNQRIYDQEVQSLNNQFTTKNIQISIEGDAIFSYLLKCQQFFQKIKDSPSVLSLHSYRKIHKKVYYEKILQKMNDKEWFNEQFYENVLTLL